MALRLEVLDLVGLDSLSRANYTDRRLKYFSNDTHCDFSPEIAHIRFAESHMLIIGC